MLTIFVKLYTVFNINLHLFGFCQPHVSLYNSHAENISQLLVISVWMFLHIYPK